MVRESYMNRESRDRAVKELRKNRFNDVVIYTLHGQNCHPMYVKDYEAETGVVLTASDKGFGNTIYRTFFKSLYVLEVR